MKKPLIILAATLFFIGVVPFAFSADVAKIGIIDFQKILTESSAGKMTQKKIEDKGNDFKKKLKTEKEQLDELRKAFEREALVLSPEKQKEKQRDFRIRVNDFKKMQEEFAKEFKQLEINLINKIQKEVIEIANKMGKDEGFLLILERKTAGVLFHPEQIDITDQIIKKYNLQIAKIQ